LIKRVIILKNKIPIVNRSYEPGESADTNSSLGEYQTIIDGISAKAFAGQKNEEVSGNNKFSYTLSDNVLFIIVSDPNELGVLEILVPELEKLFFAVFPKDFVNNWNGDDASVFKGFDSRLDQIRSAFANRIMTKPGSRRDLDTLSVMELPQRLHKTALAILDSKMASFEEVIEKTEVTPQEAVANIQEILNAGFLYTTKMGNRVYYSIKSFDGKTAAGTASAPSIAPTTEAKTVTAPVREPIPSREADRPIGLEVKKRDANKGNMPFLIKQFNKNFDRIFNAVLNRKLVLIVLDPESDKNEVLLNMILDTLQCFAPERELRIVNYAKDFIHPRDADIIRIQRDLLQFYSNEVVMAMDKKRIDNGENSIYLADIVKDMTKLKHSECVSLLINRITLVEKLSQDWAKIKKLNLPSEDFITNIRGKHNPAIIQVMDDVAENVFMD